MRLQFPFGQRLPCLDARRIFRRAAAPLADTDEQLLVHIQQRSKRALEILYDRSASAAMGIAVVILRDERLAEDVIL